MKDYSFCIIMVSFNISWILNDVLVGNICKKGNRGKEVYNMY